MIFVVSSEIGPIHWRDVTDLMGKYQTPQGVILDMTDLIKSDTEHLIGCSGTIPAVLHRGRKEMCYFMTHSTYFILCLCGDGHMVKTTQMKKNHCYHHMGYSF